MKVTALSIRLLAVMAEVLLLVTQVDGYSQKADFPQVVPNRQQHFEYDTIVVSCEGLEGLTEWTVKRKVKHTVQPCGLCWSTGPCNITNVIPLVDSGEYWCEMGGVKRSNTVNITVTAASVILESPVLPVMEGDTVKLGCRKKSTSSNLTAKFFKDGLFMESSSTGGMVIHRFSKSHEGLYKCKISGAGESPESWLLIRAAPEEPHPSNQSFLQLSALLWIGVLSLALLLLVGILQCRKHGTVRGTSPCYTHSYYSPQTVPEEASLAVQSVSEATYSVITNIKETVSEEANSNDPISSRTRRKTESGEASSNDLISSEATYSVITKTRKKKGH